jgi:hypothetical protein
MASIKGLIGRVRGDRIDRIAADVAEMKRMLLEMNDRVQVISTTLMELNHDVRSGAEENLPMFLGYTERLRLDADTAIATTQVIERQLAILEDRLITAGIDPDHLPT